MLELSHGNTYEITYNITNLDGSPKDLSGTQELKYKLARRIDSNPLVEFTLIDPEIDITDPAKGRVVVKLDKDILNPISEGTHYHELWHVNALGDPNTLMSDKLKINQKLIKE